MIFGVDPLLDGGIGWPEIQVVLLKVVLAFALLMISVMFMVWFERKIHADMTNRVGPNRAGPFGLLQTLADGIKLFFKEDLIPDKADRKVFLLAPYLSLIPAFLIFTVVPVGGDFTTTEKPGVVGILGQDTLLQIADPGIGILFVLAMSSVAVYGVMLAGWGSGSKYPLLGSVRASAQMVSYEAALGLSVAAVVLMTGTLSTRDMVIVQAGEGFAGFIPNWNVIVTGVVPFVIFLIAVTAELNRPPFDLVEAEQELVGGFHTEYSSIRFALFFLAEFMNVVTMSAIIVTLFFGGPAGPQWFGVVSGTIWFVSKLLVFLFVFSWFRATLPRFRYDQLMDMGWKALIPLSLAWLLLLAGINIGRDQGWNLGLVVAVGFAGVVLGWALLARAVGNHAHRRALEEANEAR
ncbi:MAG TPA: NADH-quinone oxidoreductase subunit NuoH [Acidimicrobiales bacterium]|nr:NADH-quinone oxidoreductase subunit NuoH [Acidimicrobiales bacterium]